MLQPLEFDSGTFIKKVSSVALFCDRNGRWPAMQVPTVDESESTCLV